MITKAARSSVGTFYTYFRSKDDVLAFVFQLFAETCARVLGQAGSGTIADTAQQLHAATRDLVLIMTLNPDIARILIAQSSGLGARLEKLRRQILANHAHFFEQLLAKCEPTPSDCALAAHCCVGAVHQCVHH
jgi:AcrR family transcriptional regulator